MSLRRAAPLVVIVSSLLAWEAAARLIDTPFFPPLTTIAEHAVANWALLCQEAFSTAKSTIFGLAIAVVAAGAIGIAMAAVPLAHSALMPIMVAAQVTPKIALAPVVFLWVQDAGATKAVLAAVISFFPLILAFDTGLRQSDRRMAELLSVLNATLRFRVFHVLLPSIAPWVLSALKLAVIYSLLGAITAEFLRPGSGLGDLIVKAEAQLKYPLMFAAVLTCTTLGFLGWGLAVFVERLFLRLLGMPRREDLYA